MPAKYQKQFAINRTEMRLIETALREQAKNLSKEMLDQQSTPTESTPTAKEADSKKQLTSRMKEIHSLLGNLHNQKVWYDRKIQSHSVEFWGR